MNQRVIFEVLSEKLHNGSITRRQFAQAAAYFGIGAAVLPKAASAAPGLANATSAHSPTS